MLGTPLTFEQRLVYNAAVSGSFQKAAELSGRWGCAISDDAIHAIVQRIAGNSQEVELPAAPAPKRQAPAFSLVVMIEDRFSQATKTLDFYHGSQHLWSLAHHLYPESKEAAAAWVGPLLHQLRHPPEHRVINTLEKILADNPDDALICREVNYFQNHRDHLNYAGLATRDAPIGSGSMESVCS